MRRTTAPQLQQRLERQPQSENLNVPLQTESAPPFNAEEWLRAQNEIDAQRFSLVPYDTAQVRDWPRVVPEPQPDPNFLEQTAIPLGLGIGKAASNALFGGLGAALQGLGQMNEAMQRQAQADYQSRLQRNGPSESMPIPSLPQSGLSRAGEWLLGVNDRAQAGADAIRMDFLGDNPNLYSRTMQGLGAMAVPLYLSWAAGGGWPGAFANAGIEAAAETGDFATDMHTQGRRDTAWVNLMNFLTNAGLGLLLERPVNEGLKPMTQKDLWRALGLQILGEAGKEALVQEPLQRIIYDASDRAQSGENYALRLLLGLGDYPRHLYEMTTGERQSN